MVLGVLSYNVYKVRSCPGKNFHKSGAPQLGHASQKGNTCIWYIKSILSYQFYKFK